MNKLSLSNELKVEQESIAGTLNSLAELAEYARNQAVDSKLKFIAYLFDMARIEVKEELKKVRSDTCPN